MPSGCAIGGSLTRFDAHRAAAVGAPSIAPGALQLSVGEAPELAAAEIVVAPAPGVVELVALDGALEIGGSHAELVIAAHGRPLALQGHAEVERGALGVSPLADIAAVERLSRRSWIGAARPARAGEVGDF